LKLSKLDDLFICGNIVLAPIVRWERQESLGEKKMRGLILGLVAAGALASASFVAAPASAQEAGVVMPPMVDSNGPIRQGNMCKQRVQPGQTDGLAFFTPCSDARSANARARRVRR
jgi:hypothetical protein